MVWIISFDVEIQLKKFLYVFYHITPLIEELQRRKLNVLNFKYVTG